MSNATRAAAQRAFEEALPGAPDPDGPLLVPRDYAYYNAQGDRARRLEMVYDAILGTNDRLLVVGTSEGGAILQKLLESDELAAHMLECGHRIALVSPAYAVGNASLYGDAFYRRAGLSPTRWWVGDQPLVYGRGVPMHVINNDVGFASLQGMYGNTSGVDQGNYARMLEAGLFRANATVTWDYYNGAPHSLPACDARRPAAADGADVNGIPNEGYYAGAHSARAADDLAALFAEFARGASWAASPRAFLSKASYRNAITGALSPDLATVFARAETAEVAAAWNATAPTTDDVLAVVVAYRVARWKARDADQAACRRDVEALRAAARKRAK